MNDNQFPNDNSQFVLSYELLYLMRWLVEHDADKLKKLVTKALASGLADEIQRAREMQHEEHNEEVQYNILEFFTLLEAIITETMNEQAVQRALQKNLMPAIDQIDSTICDDATVRSSIEKATSHFNHNTKENPKEVLFRELLKRWKPHDKNVLN